VNDDAFEGLGLPTTEHNHWPTAARERWLTECGWFNSGREKAPRSPGQAQPRRKVQYWRSATTVGEQIVKLVKARSGRA
jgi:hypothetical protein